ncbi:hypothetical protein [Paractinoplanes maris]|uniref:hypothetical protein n=1 Tax=Paractinoplanes maris TaxID=1734446 RepID=UPI0020202089|nr:hypothetical protein [Actinoplanes maris]
MGDKTTKTVTAGVIVTVVLAVYGFAADTAGLATWLGYDGPRPFAPDNTVSPATQKPRTDPTTTATSGKPGKKPTKLTAKPPDAGDPQEPTPTRPTRVAQPKGSPMGVALSGSARSTEVVDSPNGCSMGRCTFLKEAVAIGTDRFSTGWTIKCTIGCGADEWVGVNLRLNGEYSRLTATLGVDNSTDADHPLILDVINVAEDEVLVHTELKYGEAYRLKDFSVAGVVTLQIRFTGALSRAHGAVGAPVVYR